MMYEKMTVKDLLVSVEHDFLVSAYQEGLTTRNSLLAVTTQNELTRRGDYDAIAGALMKYLRDNSDIVNRDVTFARVISSSLCMLKSASPLLYKIGRALARHKEGDGEFDLGAVFVPNQSSNSDSSGSSPRIIIKNRTNSSRITVKHRTDGGVNA